MPNIKFTQLPNLGNVTATTIVPVVDSGVNYQVTGANLQTFVNTSSGNITGGNIISTGAVSATGNVSGNYILGNGSQLTGIPAQYGNANVAAYLPTFSGNLAGGNATITNSVSAATFSGSGAALTNLPGGNVVGAVATATLATTATSATTATTATTAGTVTTAAQPNITSVGTLTNLAVSGNVSANYFVGNGSALTGIVAVSTYNDANVAAFLPTYTGAMTAMTGNVTTTGNVQAAHVKGNGSALTGIVNSIQAGSGISISASTGTVTITNTGAGNTTSISNGTSNVSINSANGNVTVGVGGTANQLTIGSLSGLSLGIIANTALAASQFYCGLQTSPGVFVGGAYRGANANVQINGDAATFFETTGYGNMSLGSSGQTQITGASLLLNGDIVINGSYLKAIPSTPATSSATGSIGQIKWDANYIYVCTATNTWKRVALSTF
jgi:hypothetical protein